jgi:hypothetical protein
MSLKKFLTDFLLGTLSFFKLQLLIYMKIQKTKDFGFLTKKKIILLLDPQRP